MVQEIKKKKCFIITPIGKEGSEIRRKMEGVIDAAIEPALEEYDYDVPIVSHRLQNSGSMTAEIINGIYSADLVIANLTNNNPNVMYEVAVRHCAGKPIIHITEDINAIPFDVGDHRCIEYKDDAMGVLELKQELIKKIKYIQDNPNEISNPVYNHLKKVVIKDIPDQNITLNEVLLELNDKVGILDMGIKKLRNEIRYTENSKKIKRVGSIYSSYNRAEAEENIDIDEDKIARLYIESMGKKKVKDL